MRTLLLATAIIVSPTLAFAQAPGAREATNLAPIRISIEDAMRTVTRVSHPLAAARANTERARADVTAARSTYFPQIAASGSYLRTLESEFEGLFDMPAAEEELPSPIDEGGLPFGREHAWRVGLDVSQSIWDGGRTRSVVAEARSARTLAEIDERARRAQAVLEVTEAYYDAVLATKLVAIGEASLALAQRTFDYARLGFEQGSTAEFDMVRAEVTRDNQRTSLVRLRADRELAGTRLRQLLGLQLDRPIVLTSDLAAGDASRLAHGTAGVAEAATWLPIARARANVEASRARISRARSERWPQVSAFTSFGLVDYPQELWPDSEWRRNLTIGVNLDVPLFTGFRRTAQIRAARADRRAAEALLAEATEQTAVAERRSASDVGVARASLAANVRSAQLARRAYQIAEVRYSQGVSTYLELADARIALDQAQINQASAARDLQVARVRVALLPALPLVTTPVPVANLATITATAEPTRPTGPTTATDSAGVAPALPSATNPATPGVPR